MTGADRYAAMFRRLADRREGAFVPFLVLGDPDPHTSLALVRALARAGADALELGVPFSDPVADGPVIQAAATRALANGVRIADLWPLLARIRAEWPDLPVGLLVYANLVLHDGGDPFCARAAEAGVDSILVADLPAREAEPVHAAARDRGLAPILIAPPNASEALLAAIAARSRGYVYVTSRPGVTGADESLHRDSARLLARLRELDAPPALLGFGIGTPRQVRQALELGAAGAIAGSAVVRRVTDHLGDRDGTIAALEHLVHAMKAATRPGNPDGI